MKRLIFSVAYVIGGEGLWLGLKKFRPELKRDRPQLGVGLYNGYGGLKKPGEPIHDTAVRETQAESGIIVKKLIKCGVGLVLHDYDDTQIELHYFLVTEFTGKPRETNEMAPELFSWNKIPYGKMWPNDRHTLLRFLTGEKCIAIFKYNKQNKLMANHIFTVKNLPEIINWEDYAP